MISIEFAHAQDADGFWIVVYADGKEFHKVVFDSASEREAAQKDILEMMLTQLNASIERLH